MSIFIYADINVGYAILIIAFVKIFMPEQFSSRKCVFVAGFVVAGIFVAYKYRNLWGYVYAVLLGLIGIGSAYYHARLDFIGQTIDVAGMYFVTFVLLAILKQIRKYF